VESFEGKLAVVTGGGSGIGRELVVQLAAAGCAVAVCDVNEAGLADTAAGAAGGARVTTHVCNVADGDAVERFRDEVVDQHATDHVHLVFSNAGIGGGGSFVAGPRDEWERTFRVCWGGVYNCARAFVPLLIASDEGCLVNTSSVNGFWATAVPGIPHTAYSSAKFAVKGFSEALLEDFRLNAPHVKVAVVMPGHIGTQIIANTRRAHGRPEPEDMTAEEVAEARAMMVARGMPAAMSDDDVRQAVRMFAAAFRDTAPTSAAQAATIILDGVRAGEWRILVGDDAHALDAAVRADPIAAYLPGTTMASLIERGGRAGPDSGATQPAAAPG
jgi:NAD(P)-dependent dehydrogenase (short-subunit alcohol dehydrogenase family)